MEYAFADVGSAVPRRGSSLFGALRGLSQFAAQAVLFKEGVTTQDVIVLIIVLRPAWKDENGLCPPLVPCAWPCPTCDYLSKPPFCVRRAHACRFFIEILLHARMASGNMPALLCHILSFANISFVLDFNITSQFFLVDIKIGSALLW